MQPIIRQQQLRFYPIKRQRLTEENIIHSHGRIDIDFEPGVLTAVKLVDPVGRNSRRLLKFVGGDDFEKVWIDPGYSVGGSHVRNHIGDAGLVMREIVDESAGNDAFVPDDAKIFVGNRAVSKMNICGSAIESDGAKTPPLHF